MERQTGTWERSTALGRAAAQPPTQLARLDPMSNLRYTQDDAAAPARDRTHSPPGKRLRIPVTSNPIVFGDRSAAGVDGRRIDQPIARIARERWWKGCRGNDRGAPDRPNLPGEIFPPSPDRNSHQDPIALGQPGQLKPGNSTHRKLIRFQRRLVRGRAHPLRLGRPPLNKVGGGQDRGHGRFHLTPVLDSSSSSSAVTATPAKLPMQECRPLAGRDRSMLAVVDDAEGGCAR